MKFKIVIIKNFTRKAGVKMEEQKKQETPQQANLQESGKPVDTKKLWSIIGYIFPVIFFVPLIMEELKTNPFSKFHANQQLNLLIFGFVGCIAFIILSAILRITVVLAVLIPVLWLAFQIFYIVLIILGIINATKDKQKPLPIIGGVKILN